MNSIIKIFHKEKLDDLYRRFMAGETTVAEERRLFAAFAPGSKVPAELEPEREMMQWYASLSTDIPVSRRRGVKVTSWLSAAASLALVVTAAVGFIVRSDMMGSDDYACYRGSYVIRHGVKNTDLAEIMPEIRRVESIVASQQQAVSRAVEHTVERPALDGIDMTDPKVRALINRVLEP